MCASVFSPIMALTVGSLAAPRPSLYAGGYSFVTLDQWVTGTNVTFQSTSPGLTPAQQTAVAASFASSMGLPASRITIVAPPPPPAASGGRRRLLAGATANTTFGVTAKIGPGASVAAASAAATTIAAPGTAGAALTAAGVPVAPGTAATAVPSATSAIIFASATVLPTGDTQAALAALTAALDVTSLNLALSSLGLPNVTAPANVSAVITPAPLPPLAPGQPTYSPPPPAPGSISPALIVTTSGGGSGPRRPPFWAWIIVGAKGIFPLAH